MYVSKYVCMYDVLAAETKNVNVSYICFPFSVNLQCEMSKSQVLGKEGACMYYESCDIFSYIEYCF